MKLEIKENYSNGQIKSKAYYLNGKLHQINGPARILYNNGKLEKEFYYINGEEITDDFQILVINGLGIK